MKLYSMCAGGYCLTVDYDREEDLKYVLAYLVDTEGQKFLRKSRGLKTPRGVEKFINKFFVQHDVNLAIEKFQYLFYDAKGNIEKTEVYND